MTHHMLRTFSFCLQASTSLPVDLRARLIIRGWQLWFWFVDVISEDNLSHVGLNIVIRHWCGIGIRLATVGLQAESAHRPQQLLALAGCPQEAVAHLSIADGQPW